MEFTTADLPILVHAYVPRYVKVGPPVDLRIAEQIKQFQVRG